MKRIIIIIVSLLFLSCNNDDDLTEIRNDGFGGISCKIDGVVLKRSGGGLYGNLTARFDWSPTDRVYKLIIGFRNNQFNFSSVSMVAYDIDFDNLEGRTFELKSRNNQESHGSVTKGRFNVDGRYYDTNSNNIGELKVLLYNSNKGIITGEFFFDAVNEFGDVIKITEGRFDVSI